MIVPDMAMMQELNERQAEAYNGYASVIQFYKGFDLDADADTQLAIQAELEQQLSDEGCVCESREDGRSSFYALYGGLLFLGILLSVVFLFGTVLIMYYKQISEGYDDKARYEIMEKVGMSNDEVKKSITSQVRMVFFLPIILAACHLAAAFPLLRRLLVMCNLTDVKLIVICMCATLLVFVAIYYIVF